MRQRLRVREAAPSLLVVDCRHAATGLSLVRHSANFFDQTDSDVIETLLGNASVDAEVESPRSRTSRGWCARLHRLDFILTRAAANGLVVLHSRGHAGRHTPAIASPAADCSSGRRCSIRRRGRLPACNRRSCRRYLERGRPALQVQDGERLAFTSTVTSTPTIWLRRRQGRNTQLRRTPPRPRFGRGDRAGQSPSCSSARAWNLASGRVMCAVHRDHLRRHRPLSGVGDRFTATCSSTACATPSTAAGWKTHLQFGASRRTRNCAGPCRVQRVTELLAPLAGLQAAWSPTTRTPTASSACACGAAGQRRRRRRLARVASLAPAPSGLLLPPDIGDEVLPDFWDTTRAQPVLLGMLHSSALAAPRAPSTTTTRRATQPHQSSCGSTTEESVNAAPPPGNTLALDDDARASRSRSRTATRSCCPVRHRDRKAQGLELKPAPRSP